MSTRARILFFLPSFSGGGAERTVLNILKNYDKEVFELKVCLLDFDGHYSAMVPEHSILNSLDKGAFSISKSANPLYSLYKFFVFILPTQYRAIKTYDPDIIITVTESMNYISLIWKILGFTKDRIWVIRSGNNILAEAKSKGIVFGNLLMFLLKKAYTKADHIITLTHGAKSEIVSTYMIEESKVSVLGNPVDLEGIALTREEPIEHSYRYILGVGRLVPQKNFSLLLQGYQKSMAPSAGIHLVVLGVGSEQQQLMNLAKELGICSMVHFKGFKKNPYHYMKNAEAFVLSSKWEGFGHVLVEALACECPVISTDCNFGPAEILDNGRFGKLISVIDPLTLADGINATLSLEKEEKQEITARGKERAGNYSVEKIGKSYEVLFSKLSGNQ